MTVSVVIPTRNRCQQLRRVLDSLFADQFPDKEIIVCDGASTDGTVALLQSYGPAVRWISEPDSGEYEARNKGLALSRGEVIKYISDDDVLVPGAFAAALEHLAAHPEVDILFGQALLFYERPDGELILADARPRGPHSVTLSNFICGFAPYPTSETAFFRRSVTDRIGYFDTTLVGADYEYWARAAKAGLIIDVLDRVLVHYHKSPLSGLERRSIRLLREHWTLARRHGNVLDQAYVALVLLPLQVTLRLLYRALPPAWTLRLRRLGWHWRALVNGQGLMPGGTTP